MHTSISEGTDAETLVIEILKTIEQALHDLTFIRANHWIFGISFEKTPVHTALAHVLLKKQDEYEAILKKVKRALRSRKRFGIPNLVEELDQLQQLCITVKETKCLYTEGDAGICRIAQEDAIIRIAEEITNKGRITLTKDEFDNLYDLSIVDSSWHRYPSYAKIRIGFGISISFPEIDLFADMTRSYDGCVKTYREFEALQSNITESIEFAQRYLDVSLQHAAYCRQTVLNAFLLLEAYVNNVAFVYLSNTPALSDEDQLFLREQKRNKDGSIGSKFLSTEDKLIHWIKLISPNNQTFDKGSRPFQDFKILKQYRDALVHLAEPKIAKFGEIDFQTANQAVTTVIEMIRCICQYTAASPTQIDNPVWLKDINEDGLFSFSQDVGWIAKLI